MTPDLPTNAHPSPNLGEGPPPPVAGFRFAGVSAGIKKRAGAPDVGLIAADPATVAAGAFTTNQVVAAPVIWSRDRLADTPAARAIVVNSGNANACTGAQGAADAAEMARVAAEALGIAPGEVLVCSTGVIGAPLPMEKVRAGIRDAAQALRADGLAAFADAILTTDTRRKVRWGQVESGGRTYTAAGASKGAGMIHPNLATMLGFVVTDAPLPATAVSQLWRQLCAETFGAISIDGDTSTNDAALLLASGAAGGTPSPEALDAITALLRLVAGELARDIIRDAEGGTKIVEITVSGAPDVASARRVAEVIATSPLVKTAFHGEDPNWGRIIAAAGRSGVPLNPAALRLWIGDALLLAEGEWRGAEAEAAAHAAMTRPEFDVRLDLGFPVTATTEADAQAGCSTVWTCDFGAGYVRINADYRS